MKNFANIIFQRMYLKVKSSFSNRNCKWALDKLKSKEIKANQLVRCGLIGTASIICCKDNSAATAATTQPKQTTVTVKDFFFPGSESGDPVQPVPLVPTRVTTRKCEQACELIKNIRPKDFDVRFTYFSF